ncbi:MAG: hypothetical protein ACI9XO_002384 [Paraglaciecola sp.]|jgi:hypothetical protein
MPKKSAVKGNPKVHHELAGFNLKINEFGQIVSNVAVDKLNAFLDEHVTDKKMNN